MDSSNSVWNDFQTIWTTVARWQIVRGPFDLFLVGMQKNRTCRTISTNPPRFLASGPVKEVSKQLSLLSKLRFLFSTLPRCPGSFDCSSVGKFHPDYSRTTPMLCYAPTICNAMLSVIRSPNFDVWKPFYHFLYFFDQFWPIVGSVWYRLGFIFPCFQFVR